MDSSHTPHGLSLDQGVSPDVHNFDVGRLVKVKSSGDLTGLVQITYEDWLYHKSKWEGQIGVVLSSDIFTSGKVQVLLVEEIVFISKIFLDPI